MYCPVAQLAERLPLEQEVRGSSPRRATLEDDEEILTVSTYCSTYRRQGIVPWDPESGG